MEHSVVTRRNIPARRQADATERPAGQKRVAGRRRSRDRRRLFFVLGAALALVALGGGLWTTRSLPGAIGHSSVVEAPSALAATPLSPTSVTFTWKGSSKADSYIVRVGSDRALTSGTKRVTARGTSLTIDDLTPSTPGVEYFYRVDAVHNGKVVSSRAARFSLEPGHVSKVSATKIGADGVRVDWHAVANSRQFDVMIARDKGFTKESESVRTVGGAHHFITKGLTPATTYWLKVRPINRDQTGEFSKPVSFKTTVRETSFRVGTWNVCSEKCAGYPGRARIMAAFLDANKVDIFGLQESGGQRVGRTTAAIFSGGSQQFQRATGGAEARYIFYRPALFRQLSGSYFSIGDGRHATWAKFLVKETGRIFYYVDVHLENGHGSDATRAREMNVMLGRMAAINDTGKPMIYAGDFNSGIHRSRDSPGVKLRAAGFADTVGLVNSPINAQINSGHTFATTVLRSGDYVDHIWVSKDFGALAWKQLVRITGNSYTTPVVSDHNALSAVVALDATRQAVGKPTATITVRKPTAPATVSGLSTSLR